MSSLSRKISQKSHIATRTCAKMPNSNGTYLKNDMEYGANFLCVLVLDVTDHYDKILSKSEWVTWGPLVDLTRNDPGAT